jgi:hypothetical protein
MIIEDEFAEDVVIVLGRLAMNFLSFLNLMIIEMVESLQIEFDHLLILIFFLVLAECVEIDSNFFKLFLDHFI